MLKLYSSFEGFIQWGCHRVVTFSARVFCGLDIGVATIRIAIVLRARGRRLPLQDARMCGVTMSGGGTLRATLARVRGRFNGNTMVHLNRGGRVGVRRVSANSLSLSVTLKVNKLPHKEVIRVCKPRSSNGAALSLRYVTRKRGGNNGITFVSIRRTLSPACTTTLNISISSLLISRPSANRSTLRVTRTLVQDNTVSIVMVSSITTLIPGTRVRNRVNSDRMNLRTELVSRTLHGLTNTVSGSGYITVFVGRLHRGINIICNGPRMAANNHTLGFCDSIHVSVEEIRALGSNNRVINSRAETGIMGGGVTPPFHRTRFSVVCNRNVSHRNRLLSLTMGTRIIRGTKT